MNLREKAMNAQPIIYVSKYGSIHRDIDFTTLSRCRAHGKPLPNWLKEKFEANPEYLREAEEALAKNSRKN